MASILFVCLGNICRSPMAEGLLRQYANERGCKIEVDSAATSRWEIGNPPHLGTQKILKAAGVDVAQMFSRQLKADDFYHFDYLVGMDKENMADILAVAPPDKTAQVASFMSVIAGKEDIFIPDPYYTGDFNETKNLVKMGLKPWFEILTKA